MTYIKSNQIEDEMKYTIWIEDPIRFKKKKKE